MPKVGAVYRHYKGNIYKVLHLARHSETHEEVVVYQSVTDPEKIWVRPLGMFMEEVEWEGKTVLRFALISE